MGNGEGQEFNKLHQHVQKLHPKPQAPSEGRPIVNPLVECYFDKVRDRHKVELLEETVAQKHALRLTTDQKPIRECQIPPAVHVCFDRMIEYATSSPLWGLLPDWERAMREAVPLRLRKKYERLMEAQMDEIKERYMEEMRRVSLQAVIRWTTEDSGDCGTDCTIVQMGGKTHNYAKFLRNQAAMKNKYMLAHRLPRAIVYKASHRLPKLLLDFGKFRPMGYIEFREFVNEAELDIERGGMTIVSTYHADIARLIERQSRIYYQDVSPNKLPNFLRAADHLLSLQVVRTLMNTMDHMIEIFADPLRVPKVKLNLKCENNDLFVSPLLVEIMATHHNLLDKISKAASHLPSIPMLARQRNVPLTCPVKVPDWFIQDAHRRLDQSLEIAFEGVSEHRNVVRNKYRVVFDEREQKNLAAKIVAHKQFETCLAKLEEFQESISDVYGMMNTEYFSNCQLYQSDANAGLRAYTDETRNRIISELVARHRNFNLKICAEFEAIEARALAIPEETAELLELGRYMMKVTSEEVPRLKEKLLQSLNMLISLFELTSLDKAHLAICNETYQWGQIIKPILEKNSMLFEAKKFELEDRLQTRMINLNNAVDKLYPKVVLIDDMDDMNRIRENIEFMRKFMRHLDRFADDIHWINEQEGLFGWPISTYPRINDLRDNIIMPFYNLIYLGHKWQRDVNCWLDGPFEYLVSTVVESKTNDYFGEFGKIGKSFRTKLKMQAAMNIETIYTGSVDEPDPFQQPCPMKLAYQLGEHVRWFKYYVPLVMSFCNTALRKRHWDEINEIAGFDLTPNAGTTLRKIINFNLMSNIDAYETISVAATKELQLENLLIKMRAEWNDVKFSTIQYKDSKMSVLTALDDILALLEEQIVKVQAMRGSAFVKPIAEETKEFYFHLLRMQNTLEEWTKLQVQWMYLQPIFTSKDIIAQLPEEAVWYQEVDMIFRKGMTAVSREPLVYETAAASGLLESMIEGNELMDKVNDGVANYLEKKRLFFPRFFFLSNDDMLEILSETKDPLRVQPHLRKCFEGINKLGFDKKLDIYSFISDDKEEIMVQEAISTEAARGCVERWLLQVEEQMIVSVRHEHLMSYRDYEVNERANWVLIWPGMVVLCVSQIYWSMDVTNALSTRMESAMVKLHKKLKAQIIDMVSIVKTPLSKQNRTTMNALITIDVHAMDTVGNLIEEKILDAFDFSWLAQLRYYWEDDVLVRIINATVSYAYEYLGNTPRLVITPLTDRCYRTLVGAYYLHLNGAPEGPAGTGKTETTKDLGRALAVQCVVFNCSDGLDYKNMGKFFKGLASSGAWACFDEFNRIELEVLSVVGQQIQCIIQAVRAKVETFVFEGTELKLNPACYVCITMNPGYAGRSELPDNLKVLFRTVAMMVPDYAMISEIFLYSSGFSAARTLAVKIVTTYKLCSEQLSSQSHYDYGMRAVKTVLTAAQNIKLRFPDEDEGILLLRSLIDVNLAKFLAHDVPLFEGIISDLFPGTELPNPDYNILLKAIHQSTERNNLQPTEGFLLKIIQTYEMMIVRHGFMLVGGPAGGKTTVLYTLADALTAMHAWGDENGSEVKIETINPKSITMGQLYGQFDPISSEWTDGVAAVAFRRFCTEDTPIRKWLIFDGPVDAVWIENLNTVLDDNKKLCLTSGEVMAMTNVMSMIFETQDLLQASPATVSRCGMIYIEPHILGWPPLAKSWLNRLNPRWKEDHEEYIEMLIEWLFQPCLDFTRKNCTFTLVAGQMNQITTTLTLIEMYMDDACEDNAKVDIHNFIDSWLQGSFLCGLVWGLGGCLDMDSRKKFNGFLFELFRNENEKHPLPELMTETISMPEGLIHDNLYFYRGKGNWKSFQELVRQETLVEMASLGQMMVPTIDTVKYQYVFKRHLKHKKRFLLYGKTGTGKSFYIQDLMVNRIDTERTIPNFITFTARTTAASVQDLILSRLFKRRKGHYGPMDGASMLCFVDDVNMPAKEIYGAQPAIELLRQYFDHETWYDLKEPTPLKIYDTMFICAMAPPGGSRQELYPRFLNHFHLFEICEFYNDSISRIFSNIALIGLKRKGFSTDVNAAVTMLVAATMAIFDRAKSDLRPTPSKSHYLFNLRDFSRVITGCIMIKKESVDAKHTFVRLWVHEVMRVFGDRLTEEEDTIWLLDNMKDVIEKNLKENWNAIFDDLPKYEDKLTPKSFLSLLFGNYMDPDAMGDEKKYEEVKSIDEFQKIAAAALEDYNSTHANKMDIVLFRYALEHLSRVCRILTIPSGSSLMVGIGGSGRQSLTKLAAEMTLSALFQPEIGSTYGIPEWREDIKKVLKVAGGGKDVVFLFTENQCKDEAFLGDIDGLLNSGEVPNLFNVEETQELVEATRLAAQGGNRNLDLSVLAVMRFFVNRCKEKMHMMLCFSPIGESFRTRLRMYPSLVNCCTIDWFQVWPEEALEQVALRNTEEMNIKDYIKINSVVASKYFHACAKEASESFYRSKGRMTYITTTAFLDLIKAYVKLVHIKQTETTLARDRYIGGLDKLEFAAQQVIQMQHTLTALQPQLALSAKLMAETMKKIEKENISVSKTTKQVKIEEDAANIQAEFSKALKTECEADLALALPVLEEALAALNTLKPADITLVKSMKNPPLGVKLVMAAVCVMLNVAPDRITDPNSGKKILDYWGPSKRILSDMKFLDYLRDYDKDNIPEKIMKTIIAVYMSDKNFEPKKVAKAALAAEGLCKWVRAMVLYDEVIKVVGPKKVKLAEAERTFKETMKLLQEKRQMLHELNVKLEKLNRKLNEAIAKKIELENEVTLCANKLIRAEKLISGLGGEKNRWTECAADLQVVYNSLPGDILISCGMIAYMGPFTASYRTKNVVKWTEYVRSLDIPMSKNYSFLAVLGSEIKINAWNIYGLPRDAFSTENAIIMDNTLRWSLFIDPQSQANKWIRNMEKSNDLLIAKLTDSNYMSVIEKGIETGMPVLIENVGEVLEASLDSILAKAYYKQGGMWYMNIGDKTFEYNMDFRFYITTKLRNPHYLPEVFNKVTVINFALTIEGLEDQLLGIVVAKERPDLQEKKEFLIVQGAANNKALKGVEDDILRTLDVAGASILEDEEAIQILDSSRLISTDIQKKQVVAKETEAKIETFRMSYKPIAKHSAALYYTVTDLPNIDPMYQYSLVWFINLYVSSIETANKSNVLERRLGFLRETFTYNLYLNVCRSLFEKDKTLYSFILCTTIQQAANDLPREEMNFFLTGGLMLPSSHEDNPAPDVVSEKAWDEIKRSANLKAFAHFKEDFIRVGGGEKWRKFADAVNPETERLPDPWNKTLTPFQKLIVIRMIRPDKVIPKIMLYIREIMDARFINPPAFDIAGSFADSNALIPLIFILSAGSDPMSALMKYAEVYGFQDRFFSISLGQGQGPIAKGLIEQAQEDGCWVCLQNCHLAVSWMSDLEKICEGLDFSNTSRNFRLWLTSYPSDKFPITVLQNGVKMTNEPPQGLRQNLMRSYNSEPVKDPEFFAGCIDKDRTFTRLLYALCFFHAVIQERRNYGAQGWNIRYGFNESDFQISAQQLQIFVNDYDEVPFKAILYLTGECNYGGRVTDDRDRRCINTILLDFYNNEVVRNPDYSFSGNKKEYTLPKKFEYKDYVKQIEAIPIHTGPDILGLNMNAGITRDLEITKLFFDSMASIGGGGAVGGDSVEQGKILLALKADIYDRLPQIFDLEEAAELHPGSYSESMNTVLIQEMERFNILLAEMRKSLVMLEKAVKGLIVMTPDLEVLANHMIIGKIPPSWRRKSAYPSLKNLTDFVNDFLERLAFFEKWLREGKPPTFWISGFSFVHAFLTGAAQNYARKYKISIDLIDFDFLVLPAFTTKTAPDDGVYVYGMFLTGARWDMKKMALEEAKPKVLYDPLPLVWIRPMVKTEIKTRGRYECPLYITSERCGVLKTTGHSTNYVMNIMLETKLPVSHWIKRGLALLCQLND